ncbi:glycosyltransferase family 4 protein [Actinomycetospora corticicola]|uniref:Phosphatidylinositol alpha-mannosyltransferase n=1 Tax=Actinomycetospora corticicola TaxID=663602 RepID=A0A7Y9DV32_9PSEU|nr:glycosyltransferase family 4 protein [Actinomycetospora corticicola]NYD35974.1 phosphatidylinositol alpha-mannosyltransferase [Actinomycetospora corticicola]
MRVGIVCPYSLDVAGGVQAHVLDLARALGRLGHHVDVLAPASESTPVPEFVTRAGRAVAIPYNGSVARLTFGPVSMHRVRRWLAAGDFDVLHLHEPTAPSLSMLALAVAEGPVVATFHTSTPRSRTMLAFQPVLRPLLERVTARIAVSPLARQVYVEHLGGDAVEIPNGVDVAAIAAAAAAPVPRPEGTTTVGFVGRFDEPRKGMGLLLEALAPLDARLLVVGRGDVADLRRRLPAALTDRVDVLGAVDDRTKARALGAMDVLATPNTGGESFGIVVAEGLAAGTPVAASDIEAFRRVLTDPDTGAPAGLLLPPDDPAAWTAALADLLADPTRRRDLAVAGRARVRAFDWTAVAAAVLRVYEVAVAADPRRVAAPAVVPAPALRGGRVTPRR